MLFTKYKSVVIEASPSVFSHDGSRCQNDLSSPRPLCLLKHPPKEYSNEIQQCFSSLVTLFHIQLCPPPHPQQMSRNPFLCRDGAQSQRGILGHSGRHPSPRREGGKEGGSSPWGSCLQGQHEAPLVTRPPARLGLPLWLTAYQSLWCKVHSVPSCGTG